jgi:hypothetical protein
MAQQRLFEFEAPDSTFDLNSRFATIAPGGLYYGFDAVRGASMNLGFNHLTTGQNYVNDNLSLTDKLGVVITKQGVEIRIGTVASLPINTTAGVTRKDAVILEHGYVLSTGGNPASISVLENVTLPLTLASNQVLLGILELPINCTALNQSGVVYTRSEKPKFAYAGDVDLSGYYTKDESDNLFRNVISLPDDSDFNAMYPSDSPTNLWGSIRYGVVINTGGGFNSPPALFGSYWLVEVIRIDSARIVQVATDMDSNPNKWYRSKSYTNSENWEPWRRFATSADISILNASILQKIDISEKGVANGVVPLGADIKIPAIYIPDEYRESKVVNNIAERDAIAIVFDGLKAHVIDATADVTVSAGSAGYIYQLSTTSWSKVYEGESLDLNLWNYYTKGETDSIFTNYYTKPETNSIFTNYYTKPETDGLIAGVNANANSKAVVGATGSWVDLALTFQSGDDNLQSYTLKAKKDQFGEVTIIGDFQFAVNSPSAFYLHTLGASLTPFNNSTISQPIQNSGIDSGKLGGLHIINGNLFISRDVSSIGGLGNFILKYPTA